ncbi:MAG: CDP-diacylglycerol--serine O-phosphatidyltransferase [Myxococcaceae bacterium]
MRIRKLLFVLPNLFTVSSIFCGFYAVVLCSGEASPAHINQAALCILFAAFFDGFDGRVARLTKTQSQFGMELDSLADVMSFGVAPSLLIYKWALAPLGFLGVFLSFLFAACGALRLARFNVIAQRSSHGGSNRFFVGLPIPLAAGVVVSIVMAQHATQGGPFPGDARVPFAAGVVFLSLLMVSTVRYRTFKDLRLNRRSLPVLFVVALGGVLVASRLHPAFVVASYFGAYLLFGLLESGFLLRRFLIQRRHALGAAEEEK